MFNFVKIANNHLSVFWYWNWRLYTLACWVAVEMVKSVKMWQWLSPETVRGTPSRQLPQCLTTAWSIFRGCRQSANSGSLEFNIRDWHSALIFAIQRKFRQFRPQTCSLSNKWNWGTTFWKKDERLKVFTGTAVKYISGDYSRSTIVDLQEQKRSWVEV